MGTLLDGKPDLTKEKNMSNINRMIEHIYSTRARDGLRMDRLTQRTAEENQAEFNRLSQLKRGLHRCERNRLGRLKRLLNQ
jgi:hypothetical protein